MDTLGCVHYRGGDYEKAAPVLKQAAGMLDPVPAEVQYHLGMTYAALGHDEDAKRWLGTAVRASRPFPGIDEVRETLSRL